MHRGPAPEGRGRHRAHHSLLDPAPPDPLHWALLLAGLSEVLHPTLCLLHVQLCLRGPGDGPAAVLLQAAAVPADCAEPVGVAECLVWHYGPGVPLQRCDIRPPLHDSFLDKNFFSIEIKIL